jgi:molybdopterin synthase sulfur carrier subunit
MVRLLYFARVRERIGRSEEQFDIDAPLPLGLLVEQLSLRSQAHAAAFADRSRLRAAINLHHAGWEALVHAGDEVALFPPVTGG